MESLLRTRGAHYADADSRARKCRETLIRKKERKQLRGSTVARVANIARRGAIVQALQRSARPAKRRKVLEEADTLSEKPRRLYQQVLRETGPGGTQMQFPAAAAGAFFGLAPAEARQATFIFPTEVVNVRIAHYPNITNRIPLRTLAQ